MPPAPLDAVPWAPLLTGADAARALASAATIAERLPERGAGATLATGHAGFAVLHAALADAVPEDARHRVRAVGALEEAASALAGETLGAGLWDGVTGVAWAAAHLASSGLVDGDAAADIDDALCGALEGEWRGGLDVISGLAGVAVYLLARRERPPVARALARVVDVFEEAAEAAEPRARDGVAWRTPPALLVPLERAEHPAGCVYLGAAHGMAGIVAMLARVAAAGIEHERAARLARGGAAALLAHAGGDGPSAAVPEPTGTPEAPRGSWCHGVPGVASALLVAARALGDRALHAEAAALARRAAARPTEDDFGVRAHTGLCHGAAGVAHLHARMHHATRDPACRDAAARWLSRAVDLGPPPDAGLLQGAAGYALALVAAATARPPAWDALFLASP